MAVEPDCSCSKEGLIAGKAGFEVEHVGTGGAGMLWEMHFDEKETLRTSLLRPPLDDVPDDSSSDDASVSTIEDVVSVSEPMEIQPDVSFSQRLLIVSFGS